MAGPSRLGSVSGSGLAPPSGRMILLDSRSYANPSPIEGVFGAPPVNFDGHWRPNDDDGSGRGGQSSRRSGQSQFPFTPLVAMQAAAYPASEVQAADMRVPPPLFLTDLLRGVGVYEFNMRVFAGTTQTQGHVVNRYS